VDALILYNLKRAMTALNDYLSTRTYLVGHAVTLADIVLVCNLTLPLHLALTKEFTAEYPHLMRYFWTVINQPQFKKIMGDGFVQATKPLGPPPAKIENKSENKIEDKIENKNENKNKHEKSSTSRPEGHRRGKKEGGKKAEATPKAKVEVPPPKPAPQPEEPDVEEEEAPVKKSKNALDLLPPSPMVLDNWKRLYSNTKAKDFHLAINGVCFALARQVMHS
jgi:elongation factor 1-gamma